MTNETTMGKCHIAMKEGDRVFTYGYRYEVHEGTIHKNTEYPEVSEWYIKYDDGSEFAVLNINGVYKVAPGEFKYSEGHITQ